MKQKHNRRNRAIETRSGFPERLEGFLWPNICPFCGKASREGICGRCRKELSELIVQEPRCMKCGKQVRYQEQEYCYDCMHTDHAFEQGVSLWLHKKPVSLSIYHFKYHNQRFFAKQYAHEIVKNHEALIRRWNPEILIPVPLHPARRRKRGYNQSELLAAELGKILGIPVANDAVKRVRNTRPQKTLDIRKRRQNLAKAFLPGRPSLCRERVLIVDDIYTTGNTIDAVAKTLKQAGVQKVYFLTISIGQGY